MIYRDNKTKKYYGKRSVIDRYITDREYWLCPAQCRLEVLTFKNAKKLKETVEILPMDRIVIETDCPYLAPVPHRGERNDSRRLAYVVRELAQMKGITEEEVRRITWENACRLYRMDA